MPAVNDADKSAHPPSLRSAPGNLGDKIIGSLPYEIPGVFCGASQMRHFGANADPQASPFQGENPRKGLGIWPRSPCMDHDARVRLARRVTDFVLRKHPDTVAVGVHGSTAKGEDRDHSDLDMFAITRGISGTRAYEIVHEGIVVEVQVSSLDDALRDAASFGSWWPFDAGRWTSYLPMHDPDGVLPRLADRAKHPDSSMVPVALRSRLLVVYEYVCKMRNRATAGEGEPVEFLSSGLALNAACFLGLLNRQHFSGWRNLLTKPRGFEKVPPHLWDDYPVLMTASGDAPSLLGHAERLYQECADLLTSEGYAYSGRLDLEEALERGRVPG